MRSGRREDNIVHLLHENSGQKQLFRQYSYISHNIVLTRFSRHFFKDISVTMETPLFPSAAMLTGNIQRNVNNINMTPDQHATQYTQIIEAPMRFQLKF